MEMRGISAGSWATRGNLSANSCISIGTIPSADCFKSGAGIPQRTNSNVRWKPAACFQLVAGACSALEPLSTRGSASKAPSFPSLFKGLSSQAAKPGIRLTWGASPKVCFWLSLQSSGCCIWQKLDRSKTCVRGCLVEASRVPYKTFGKPSWNCEKPLQQLESHCTEARARCTGSPNQDPDAVGLLGPSRARSPGRNHRNTGSVEVGLHLGPFALQPLSVGMCVFGIVCGLTKAEILEFEPVAWSSLISGLGVPGACP